MLKAIGFELENQLEILLGESRVIRRVVVRGEGVAIRTGILQQGVVLLFGVVFRPAEHHVLEEVGKTRFPRFDFISGAGLHHHPESQEVRETGGNGHEPQAVGQIVDEIGIREQFIRRHKVRRQEKKSQHYGQTSRHR